MFRRDQLSSRVHRGHVKKSTVVLLEQRLHVTVECVVARAGVAQESRPRCRRSPKRLVIKPLDPLPPFTCHGVFLPSPLSPLSRPAPVHVRATPSRPSSRASR